MIVLHVFSLPYAQPNVQSLFVAHVHIWYITGKSSDGGRELSVQTPGAQSGDGVGYYLRGRGL